jgi:hypothetical protein
MNPGCLRREQKELRAVSGEPPGSDTQHVYAMLCLPGTPPAETGKTGKKQETEEKELGCLPRASVSRSYLNPSGGESYQRQETGKKLKTGMFPGDTPGALEGAK